MTRSPHDIFTDYLQTRHRLGEREIALSPHAVAALRRYRRPGAAVGPATPAPPPPDSPAPAAQKAAVRNPSAEVRPGGGVASVKPVRPAPAEGVRLELPDGDKASKLAFIAESIRNDDHCRMLFQRSKNMVLGTGSPDAEIMFVGEAPGEEEDEQGEPFVGRAGQLLNKMIQAMGLARSAVYIANVCKYRPDMPVGATGNRKPTSAEMAACLPYLRAQIGVVSPKVIVALGATAVEGLFNLTRAPIMKMRGEWMEWEGIPVMPTYHPAYLLRNESVLEKRKAWEDLMRVMEKAGMTVTEKQRNFFRKAA